MMTPEKRQILLELGKSSQGKVLREFLEERYLAIGDITTCKNWEDAVGRQHALILLKEIFNFLEDKQPPQGTKSQYT